MSINPDTDFEKWVVWRKQISQGLKKYHSNKPKAKRGKNMTAYSIPTEFGKISVNVSQTMAEIKVDDKVVWKGVKA